MNTAFRKRSGREGTGIAGFSSFLLVLVVLGFTCFSPETTAQSNEDKRPRIGLVLAGGGAKGGAHVGVLKVLEALRIPIDYIAGTSMGSIVGGLYASGMSPEEIEEEINGIDWDDIFEDEPNREDLSFRRKKDDRLYMFNAKPGFNDGKFDLPLAYVHGQKLDLQLNRLTQRVAGVVDFDQLPIPYRAVAADLETGKEVILGSGNLSRAIRASMAVPGAFDPVEIDGKLLADGGIANNIPVSVARGMGADIVIVSDLGSELLTRDQIRSGLDVAGQMANLLFGLNSLASLKTLRPQDTLISTKLGDIGASSFDRIGETIPLGEKAAREQTKKLRRYSLNEAAFARHQAARWQPKSDAPVIAFIEIENNSAISDEVVAGYLSAEPGSPLNVSQLEKDIQQIYGLDIFKSVRYEVVERDGDTGLLVRAENKPWGPGYLQAGAILSANPDGDVAFRLGAAFTKTEINALNGEWRIGAQIGDEPSLFAEIYQPLDAQGHYFTSATIGYFSEIVNTFDASGNWLSKNQFNSYGIGLGFGRELGTWGEIRLDYLRKTGAGRVLVGTPEPDRDFDSGQISLGFYSDKLDSLNFPTKGHLSSVNYIVSNKKLGADTDFENLNLGHHQAYSWGRNTLVGGLSLSATIDGDLPVYSLQRLGGFLKLSGFQQDQLSGQYSGIARGIYMRRISNTRFFQAYLGASLEVGNVWQDSGDIGLGNTITAGSLFVGADTPVGPLYLAYGMNDQSEESLYLFIGPLFSF